MPHWVGIVGAALNMFAFVPQIALLFKTHQAGALSVRSNVLNMTASGFLFAYAWQRGDLVFIVVMGYQLAASALIAVLNVLYRDGKT
jgi:uncharacterized protein with PQ loop repeat